MKFRVAVQQVTNFVYIVEADSVDEAVDGVLSGDLEPDSLWDWDEEITDVYKLED